MTPPPSSSTSVPVDERPWYHLPRRSRVAVGAIILACLPFVAWGGCATKIFDPDDEGGVVWLVAAVLAFAGSIVGLVNWIRLRRKPTSEKVEGQGISFAAMMLGFLSPFITFVLGFLTVDMNLNFGHGRALRRRGRPRVPALVDNGAWLGDPGPRVDAPAAVADAWRAAGATEAASVAAFAHVANELLALGAPPALVEGAHRAALDEVHHARLCFALAARIDGKPLGPGAFPAAITSEGAHDVVGCAAGTAVESCLFEGASARVARMLLARNDLAPAPREVLDVIAGDEAAHAAHGWDVVEWCAGVAGQRARDAAMRAILAIDIAAVLPAAPSHLEAFGVASAALWREALLLERDACLARLRPSSTRAAA
jgi:hypothetical protein